MDGTDTSLGGRDPRFPSTEWTALRRALEGSGADLGEILQRYWKPVYRYVRIRWSRSNEDAKDLTQGFLAMVIESDALRRADPGRGSLRAYLKGALEHFLTDEGRRENARKRGRGRCLIGVDPGELAVATESESPDSAFDREWSRNLLASATSTLERTLSLEGKRDHFEAFRLFHRVDPPLPHVEIARRLDRRPGDVDNFLRLARKRLREIVVDLVRDYASTPEEIEEQLRSLLEP